MSSESEIKNFGGKALKSLRINLLRNLPIAVSSTAYVFPSRHPFRMYKKSAGINCLGRPAGNPEVGGQGHSNYWLLESQSLIVLERV